MSGHGHREAAWQLDAILWHDRVYADVHSEQGRAAARQHHVSPWLIGQAAALIARYIARGEDVVSLADTVRRAPTWGDEGRPISAQHRSLGGHCHDLCSCARRPYACRQHRS